MADLSAPMAELLKAILAETVRVEALPEFTSLRDYSREDAAEIRTRRRDLKEGLGVNVRRVRFGDGSAAARMARSRMFARLEKVGLIERHDETNHYVGTGSQTTHVSLTKAGREQAEKGT